MVISCRFYAEKYPEVEDVVMVTVRSIAEMGAYVDLLEYNNIEGMILLSELSRRRIRSINKLIRVGRNECVVVIRVDKEKGDIETSFFLSLCINYWICIEFCVRSGYIDLSKRRVSAEDIAKCDQKFAYAKAVGHLILSTIFAQLKIKNYSINVFPGEQYLAPRRRTLKL